jgi:hypothetical protein
MGGAFQFTKDENLTPEEQDYQMKLKEAEATMQVGEDAAKRKISHTHH